MGYSKKIVELSEKYRQFFLDKTKGQILCMICPYTFRIDYGGVSFLPQKTPDMWVSEDDAAVYAINGVKSMNHYIQYTSELDNDYVPAVSVNLGYGVHSAYYTGQEVIFGEETSWTHPFIKDWKDMDSLKMDENNRWFQTIKAITRLYMENAGDFAVSTFSNAGPGDMANAIRGNDIFYDIYDEPEKVHELMSKCADAMIWLEDELRQIAGTVNGGVVTANMWFPGTAPYLSMDFNDLCAQEIFLEFDCKYTQRKLNYYGGAYIHHHAKGYHIHKHIAKLKNLTMLEISLDPKCLRPIDHIPELYEMHDGLPLLVRCSPQDVYGHIEELKQGRVMIMLDIKTLDEGKEAMRFIRKNSII